MVPSHSNAIPQGHCRCKAQPEHQSVRRAQGGSLCWGPCQSHRRHSSADRCLLASPRPCHALLPAMWPWPPEMEACNDIDAWLGKPPFHYIIPQCRKLHFRVFRQQGMKRLVAVPHGQAYDGQGTTQASNASTGRSKTSPRSIREPACPGPRRRTGLRHLRQRAAGCPWRQLLHGGSCHAQLAAADVKHATRGV
jgi:hypothetical protein